jgi:hypothetical protein
MITLQCTAAVCSDAREYLPQQRDPASIALQLLALDLLLSQSLKIIFGLIHLLGETGS